MTSNTSKEWGAVVVRAFILLRDFNPPEREGGKDVLEAGAT